MLLVLFVRKRLITVINRRIFLKRFAAKIGVKYVSNISIVRTMINILESLNNVVIQTLSINKKKKKIIIIKKLFDDRCLYFFSLFYFIHL
jgi:hypothetical protein